MNKIPLFTNKLINTSIKKDEQKLYGWHGRHLVLVQIADAFAVIHDAMVIVGLSHFTQRNERFYTAARKEEIHRIQIPHPFN